MRLPSVALLAAAAGLCRVQASKPMPSAPQATATQIRAPISSFRKTQLIRATTAGMAAMITPADTALVRLTPNSMQIENRKLPRNDSRNSSCLVCRVMGASLAGFLSQPAMAMPPMPKRSQASRNTGRAATSGLDSAT